MNIHITMVDISKDEYEKLSQEEINTSNKDFGQFTHLKQN
jgi:hypothetical protein